MCVVVLGLSSGEGRVLGADVALCAGRRLEGHGAAGALVEDFAVGGLDVGLDGVQSPEHDLAAGASGSSAVTDGKRVADQRERARWEKKSLCFPIWDQ